MSRKYYESINKIDILSNPSNYAWNNVLHYIQFSQDEIIYIKEWIEIPELIKYQQSITTQFLRKHFQKEIDSCLEIDWNDIYKIVSN
jgi:hypothetical protein